MIAGLAAFIGHIAPVWLQFKGGKGVATFLGVLFGLNWPTALIFCAVWLSAAALWRYSSLAALIASATAPLVLLHARPWRRSLCRRGDGRASSSTGIARTSPVCAPAPKRASDRRRDRGVARSAERRAARRLAEAHPQRKCRAAHLQTAHQSFRRRRRGAGRAAGARGESPCAVATIRIATREEVLREIDAARALGVRFATTGDPDYPPLLREIADAPPLIAMRGVSLDRAARRRRDRRLAQRFGRGARLRRTARAQPRAARITSSSLASRAASTPSRIAPRSKPARSPCSPAGMRDRIRPNMSGLSKRSPERGLIVSEMPHRMGAARPRFSAPQSHHFRV